MHPADIETLWRVEYVCIRTDGLSFTANTFQVGRAIDILREALSWPRNPGDEVWIMLSEARYV